MTQVHRDPTKLTVFGMKLLVSIQDVLTTSRPPTKLISPKKKSHLSILTVTQRILHHTT